MGEIEGKERAGKIQGGMKENADGKTQKGRHRREDT
jgi:hypothetical protein